MRDPGFGLPDSGGSFIGLGRMTAACNIPNEIQPAIPPGGLFGPDAFIPSWGFPGYKNPRDIAHPMPFPIPIDGPYSTGGGNLPGTRPSSNMPGFGMTVTSYGEFLGSIFAKYGPPVAKMVMHRRQPSTSAGLSENETKDQDESSSGNSPGKPGIQTSDGFIEGTGAEYVNGKTKATTKSGEEGRKYQQGQHLKYEAEAALIAAEFVYDAVTTILTLGTSTAAKKGLKYAARKAAKESLEEIGEAGGGKILREGLEAADRNAVNIIDNEIGAIGFRKTAKSLVQQNKAASEAVEEALYKIVGGRRNIYRSTSEGARYVDILVDGKAMEVKMGRVSYSGNIKSQVAKDIELLGRAESHIKEYEWHFYRGKTGIGPTGPLKKALEKGGIRIIIH